MSAPGANWGLCITRWRCYAKLGFLWLRPDTSEKLKPCDFTINTINYLHDDLPTRTGFHYWPGAFRRRSNSRS